MSHTPGPWTCFYKSKYDEWHVSIPVPDSTMHLALFDDGIRGENREADARLIAAAPELLAALREMCDRWDPASARPDRRIWDAAMAAIAKAEGTT